jgi:hypothetical protein
MDGYLAPVWQQMVTARASRQVAFTAVSGPQRSSNDAATK